MSEINPNRLYTTAEAAEFLSVPIRSMSSYIKQGVIPGQKLGPRQWRISGRGLLDMLTSFEKSNDKNTDNGSTGK